MHLQAQCSTDHPRTCAVNNCADRSLATPAKKVIQFHCFDDSLEALVPLILCQV